MKVNGIYKTVTSYTIKQQFRSEKYNRFLFRQGNIQL